MRATDDATEAPRHIHRSFPSAALATLALAVLTGAAIGATFALVTAPRHEALFEARLPWTADAPTRSEWPREPRAGESARVVTSGTHLTLVVRAARAPIVRELAAAIAHRRATAVDALVGARAQARARWLSSRRAQPLPLLSTVAERASLPPRTLPTIN